MIDYQKHINTFHMHQIQLQLKVIIVLVVFFSLTVLMVCFGYLQLGGTGRREKEPCPGNASLSLTQTINHNIVSHYPVGDSGPYLKPLGLTRLKYVADFDGEPVVVTAASSTHFSRVVGLLENMAKHMKPRMQIVIYNIGLTGEQRAQICRGNRCQIRDFPFHQFPSFVEDCLACIAWKPLVIQLALEEFGFVIWMDSAVYVPDGDLQAGIDMAKREGISLQSKDNFMPEANLAFETDTGTFEALGEHACAFENSYRFSAALIFIRKSSYTYTYIMRPWVSCALTQSCIATGRAPKTKCVYANYYGYCHRFAQSVLSIILNRLYHSELEKIDLKSRIKWRKCYLRQEHIVIDDMVFIQYEKQDIIQCPEVKWVSSRELK